MNEDLGDLVVCCSDALANFWFGYEEDGREDLDSTRELCSSVTTFSGLSGIINAPRLSMIRGPLDRGVDSELFCRELPSETFLLFEISKESVWNGSDVVLPEAREDRLSNSVRALELAAFCRLMSSRVDLYLCDCTDEVEEEE